MARIATFSGDELVVAVASTGQAVGLDTLQARFPDVPRRTLQRRLAELVAGGRLVAEGSARARRYRAGQAPEDAALDGYLPNVSYFLPRALRAQLRASAAVPFEGILSKARSIQDPYEQAFFLWLGLAWLHVSAGGREGPFLEAIRALRESNRMQPLRDLFVAACGPAPTP